MDKSAEIDDAQLLRCALRNIEWDPLVPDESICVEVQAGWVTLRGFVRWYDQKKRAEENVSFLAGVKGVTNALGYIARPDATMFLR